MCAEGKDELGSAARRLQSWKPCGKEAQGRYRVRAVRHHRLWSRADGGPHFSIKPVSEVVTQVLDCTNSLSSPLLGLAAVSATLSKKSLCVLQVSAPMAESKAD